MATRTSFHEDFSRSAAIKASSDRAFGLTVGGVLALFGAIELVTSDPSAWMAAVLLSVAGGLVVAALTVPTVLAPLNAGWRRFGLVLSKITNPLVMALIFFAVITPIGLLMRALGKTPLALTRDTGAESYWITRDPPGPEPGTMNRQF